ncbi:MAG: hypothetical protein QXJ17_04370 [Nitrososphaeria archaeon]
MRVHVFAASSLTILLLLSFLQTSVYAASSVPITVRCVFEDGRPAANVLVEVYHESGLFGKMVTDLNGKAVLNLPANETFTFKTSWFGWNDQRQITVKVPVTLEFSVNVVVYPVEKAFIPLRLVTLTPGGFSMYFEKADKVNATVQALQGTKYSLTIQGQTVTFRSNETDTYFIFVNVQYRDVSWRSITLSTFSDTTSQRVSQSMLVYSPEIEVQAVVDGVPAPHYPTSDEVAEAMMKQWQAMKNDIIKSVVQSLRDEMQPVQVGVKNLQNKTGELSQQIDILSSLSKDMSGFMRNTLNSFQANAWTSIVVFAAIVLILLIAIYMKREMR